MKRSTLLPLVLVLTALTALSIRAQETPDPLWKSVDGVFGVAGKDLAGGTHRFGWPRRDLHVQVGGHPSAPHEGGAGVRDRGAAALHGDTGRRPLDPAHALQLA